MGDELLDAIFALENEIQQQLLEEQERAGRWLAGVREEQQCRLEAAREEFEAAHRQALDEAYSTGEARAAAIEAEETAYCKRLTAIRDSVLREVLDRELAGILPGQAHDHQDGES